jgi:hypothetical protein
MRKVDAAGAPVLAFSRSGAAEPPPPFDSTLVPFEAA